MLTIFSQMNGINDALGKSRLSHFDGAIAVMGNLDAKVSRDITCTMLEVV